MPLLPRLIAAGARLFYRLELAGPEGPAQGPVLYLANHPSALLDPALVSLAAERPVRFLAKSTLFHGPKTPRPVQWIVRSNRSIPVYRRMDGEVPAEGNAGTFAAAHTALGQGDAVGMFPEGISHAFPTMTPVKTGAARLALGHAKATGQTFPIVPVGLTLSDRAVFRSTGLVVRGTPVAWDDLLGRGEDDVAAVRELTARIAASLRDLTINYTAWTDAPFVAFAEAVHRAGQPEQMAGDAEAGRADRLARRRARLAVGARALAEHRMSGDLEAEGEVRALERDLRSHQRLLRALGLRPTDLHESARLRTALGWGMRRLPLLALGLLTALGTALLWIPYHLVGRLAPMYPQADEVDVLGTAKFLIGGTLYLVWTLLLALGVGFTVGPLAGIVTLVVVPALALLTLVTAEGWQGAARDARRFLTLRQHAGRIAELRDRQAMLAGRLDRVLRRPLGAPPATGVDV